METYECIIIWAWAAGVGVALKLQELWVDYLVLEWETIGSSFKKWNTSTHFISPSFPSNAFGQVDLNSIHHETSPGFMFGKEHPNGQEYAQYLQRVVEAYGLKIQEGEKVIGIAKDADIFRLETTKSEYKANYVISATWEFQYPYNGDIVGSEHAIHSSKIPDYKGYAQGDSVVPIAGWYESAVDSAYGLYKQGRAVHIFCLHQMNKITTSDTSQTLSLNSMERLREMQKQGNVIFSKEYISKIKKKENGYQLVWESGEEYDFSQMPILATGFRSWLEFLWDLVSERNDRNPELNSVDEVQKTKGLFVVGPQVRQWELIFCFVYKYRLRFGVVALEIARRLEKDLDYDTIQDVWEKQWFYLDELGTCGDECQC